MAYLNPMTCGGCKDTVLGSEVVLYGPSREWLCLECVEDRTIGNKNPSMKGRQLEGGNKARRAWRRRISPADQ